jgi:hypothetical protein
MAMAPGIRWIMDIGTMTTDSETEDMNGTTITVGVMDMGITIVGMTTTRNLC